MEDVLQRLHNAAYAGRVKFRGIREHGDLADGLKDIDPAVFAIPRLFNWRQDVITSEADDRDWYFVHLDKQQFVSLLESMGLTAQAPRNTHRTGAPGKPTTAHVMERLAKEMLDAGTSAKDLTEFAAQVEIKLDEYLRIHDPDAPRLKAKTIRNRLTKMWKSRPK